MQKTRCRARKARLAVTGRAVPDELCSERGPVSRAMLCTIMTNSPEFRAAAAPGRASPGAAARQQHQGTQNPDHGPVRPRPATGIPR